MSLIRWTPNRTFDEMFDNFSRMFDERLSRIGADRQTMTLADWRPACDIQETAESYVVHAELPDVKKEDVKLSVQNGVLMLAGERKQEKEEKGRKFHRVERSFGRFERSFELPESIDDKKIEASYKDGVLHVILPKAPATKAASHEIKIS